MGVIFVYSRPNIKNRQLWGLKMFETHIRYNVQNDNYAIRSCLLDGTNKQIVYRPLYWLQSYIDKDIPYNWDVVKQNPAKWFLL